MNMTELFFVQKTVYAYSAIFRVAAILNRVKNLYFLEGNLINKKATIKAANKNNL